MLGFSPKLPVSDEDRTWVDDGFRRLEKLVGRQRMLEAKVVLPSAEDFPDPYAQARQSGASAITHPDLRWGRCDIKSTNLLANVLAMQAARDAGCLEALFYLSDGTITEGTHTSVFGGCRSFNRVSHTIRVPCSRLSRMAFF